MIRLHYSNRMEALLARLAEEIGRERAAEGCWRPVWVAVPNRQTERIIREHLAAHARIAANLDFTFLDGMLQRFLPEGARLVDRVAVQAILLRRFRTREGLDSPLLQPVVRYLDSPDPERRLPQLAFKLAGLFEEYLMSRPEWFALWDVGRDLDGAKELERCERALWQLVRADLLASGGRWLLPGDLAASLRHDGAGLPQRLHLFGMAHLAPVYQKVLDAIGHIVPQTLVYSLNPCREYWDDVKDGRAQRQLARRQAAMRSSGEGNEDDPYALQVLQDAEQPLLRRWGRPGREKIHLLNELADWDFEGAFEDPGQATLLAALQRDVLLRQPPQRVDPAFLGDGSVVVHVCPNPRREAEVIAEQIWSLVREDKGQTTSPPLRFSDIAVLVPKGDLEVAVANLAGAFGGDPPIPFTPLQRSAGALHELAEAFGLLLDLAASPMSRADVLGFVGHPAVGRHFEDLDPDSWAAWCEETGIVRGVDRQDLGPTYFPEDALSWDQGLRRMALGAFMGGTGEAYRIGTQTYTPREVGVGAWIETGTFIHRARALLGELRRLSGEQRTFASWGRRFAGLLDAWIGGEERRDVASLARLRSALLRLAVLDPTGLAAVEHSFRTAAELARQEIDRILERATGSRLHGVAVADPEALRGIPFRVVFVAGLGEGAFPGRQAADAMDLRSRKRLPGDVPAHERDRYLFLEALLSARDRLFLSYTERDPATGETLQPSPLIAELLEVIASMSGGADLAPLQRTHRLLRWDAERFSSHPDLLPAAPAVYLEAAAASWRQLGRAELPPPEDPALGAAFPALVRPADPRTPKRIGLHILRAFLESPLQGSARGALGLEDEEEDPGGVSEEPAATGAILRVPLLREAFWSSRSARRGLEEAYLDLRASLERDGKAPLGHLAEAERTLDLEVLRVWAEQVPAQVGVTFLRLGGSARVAKGVTYQVLPPLRLELPGEGGSNFEVELTGALEPQGELGEGPGSILLVDGSLPTRGARLAKRVIRAWLDQLVLACLGMSEGGKASPHRAYLVAGKEVPEAPAFPGLDAVGPEEARSRLRAILQDLLRNRHPHLLPLEAVINTKEIQSGEQFAFWVEHQLDDPSRAGLSDRYGPVPHPLTYPAASWAQLESRRSLLSPVLTALGGGA